jgi:sortase A
MARLSIRQAKATRCSPAPVSGSRSIPVPWDKRQQKNVYLAGHQVGYSGAQSRLISYNLAMLSERDSTVLTNGSGNAYKYRVSQICVNKPDGGWLLDPVRNRDTVTLQTCTYPTFENRFIVRADRA